ncbi:Histone-Lysine N-Methyltransferase 2B [Manis pentadactyla]|nr:Histone-Lysine N-Methyltransferase 2B [Manis pentadactyla]
MWVRNIRRLEPDPPLTCLLADEEVERKQTNNVPEAGLPAGDLDDTKQSLLSLDFQELYGEKSKHEVGKLVLFSAYHFSN